MGYCTHFTSTPYTSSKHYCNPCFGRLDDGVDEVHYYPTGARGLETDKHQEFWDYYIKDFVMSILPEKYFKRISFGESLPTTTPDCGRIFAYPAITINTKGLRRREFLAVLQMFRYPFEWPEFETAFVQHMQDGRSPTDAWIHAHNRNWEIDHGLLNYWSLDARNRLPDNTYDLTARFERLENCSNVFAAFAIR